MQTLLQSSTARALVFFMYDSADHVTGKTGLSPTVVISKNGASFASPSGAVSEIGNGFYKVAGNATDSNTLGTLALSATASGADQATMAYNVVAYAQDDAVRLGLTALPNAAAEASGGLPTNGTSTGQILLASGKVVTPDTQKVDVNTIKTNPVVNGGTITFPTNKTLAAPGDQMDLVNAPNVTAVAAIQNGLATPTNITAGSITTVGSVTSPVTVGTNSDKTGYSLDAAYDAAKTAAQVSNIPTAIENADALLKRDWTSVTGEAARSVLNALRFLRNRWYILLGILHITKEDDATDAWTSVLTGDNTGVPVKESDPT